MAMQLLVVAGLLGVLADEHCLLQSQIRDLQALRDPVRKVPETQTAPGAYKNLLRNAFHAYSVIIDAGSSKTKVVIYQNLTEMSLTKEQKGTLKGLKLTAFEDPCDAVGEVQKLLSAAEELIPSKERSGTPAWLRGTAGLRLLDPVRTDAVMECLNERMAKPGATDVDWQDAKVASGDMEAVYGFLAARHIYGDVGSLEMGGASAQMAFAPETAILNNEFVYQPGKSIYAKSYQGFGQDQALRRSYELQIKEHPGKVLLHPCLPSGKRFEHSASSTTYEVIGTSDGPWCEKLVLSLMHRDYECLQKPCAIAGVYQPKISGKFKAFSAFFYMASGLGVLSSDSSAVPLSAIKKALGPFCKKSFQDLEKEGSTKYSQYYCFNGWFAYSMLSSLGFDDDSTMIEFANDVSWTLGALIYLTGASEAR